jgi:hypothetical protein
MIFRDFHIEIHRKFNAKWKATVMYLNWVYNKDIIQGLSGFGTIFADMAVVDVAYKINSSHTIRVEAQALLSKQDFGSWAMGMIEYTFAPNWFVAVVDQYNYGNSIVDQQIHYITGNIGMNLNTTNIRCSFGRQRAGIVCVGGVCRNVPASNGVQLSVTSSF